MLTCDHRRPPSSHVNFYGRRKTADKGTLKEMSDTRGTATLLQAKKANLRADSCRYDEVALETFGQYTENRFNKFEVVSVESSFLIHQRSYWLFVCFLW